MTIRRRVDVRGNSGRRKQGELCNHDLIIIQVSLALLGVGIRTKKEKIYMYKSETE